MRCGEPRTIGARPLNTERYFFGGVVVGGEVSVAFGGVPALPKSDVGTFVSGFFSPSQPTAKAPTQIVRTNANGFRIVANPFDRWFHGTSKCRRLPKIPKRAKAISMTRGLVSLFPGLELPLNLVGTAGTACKTCGFPERGTHLGDAEGSEPGSAQFHSAE